MYAIHTEIVPSKISYVVKQMSTRYFKRDNEGKVYHYEKNANHVLVCSYDGDDKSSSNCVKLSKPTREVMSPEWTKVSTDRNGTERITEHSSHPNFKFVIEDEKKCGMIELEAVTMQDVMSSSFSFECFLRLWFGFQEIVFLKFILSSTRSKCYDVDACIDRVASKYSKFFEVGIPTLAADIYYNHFDAIINLFVEVYNWTFDDESFPIGSIQLGIDRESLMQMSAFDVATNLRKYMLEFIAKADEKYGIAQSCEQDVTTYVDEVGKYKRDEQGRPLYTTTDIRRTRSPSMYNATSKNLCPPLHELEETTGRLWRTKNKCCVYKPLKKWRSQVTLMKTSMKLLGDAWSTESAMLKLYEFSDTIVDNVVALDEKISELQAAIDALKVKSGREFVELNYKLQPLLKEKNLWDEENLQLARLAQQKTEYDKAQERYEHWKTISAASGNSDKLIDRLQYMIISTIEHLLYKLLYTDDSVKRKRSIERKRARRRGDTGHIQEAVSAAGYEAATTLMNLSVNLIVWFLHNPALANMILNELKRWKNMLCDQFAVKKGNYRISSAGKMQERVDDMLAFTSVGLYSILIQFSTLEQLSEGIFDGAQLLIGVFVGEESRLSKAFGKMKCFFVDAVYTSIKATVLGKMYQDGVYKMMELLDLTECSNHVVTLQNRSFINDTDDGPFTSYAHFLSKFGFNQQKTKMYVGKDFLSFNGGAEGGYMQAAVRMLIIRKWNEQYPLLAIKEGNGDTQAHVVANIADTIMLQPGNYLKWTRVDSRPVNGVNITNVKMGADLQQRHAQLAQQEVKFDNAEWDSFDIKSVTFNHYFEYPSASALKWTKLTSEVKEHESLKGREIHNSGLIEALKKQTTFTDKEWKAFDIKSLGHGDYVTLSGARFVPHNWNAAFSFYQPAKPTLVESVANTINDSIKRECMKTAGTENETENELLQFSNFMQESKKNQCISWRAVTSQEWTADNLFRIPLDAAYKRFIVLHLVKPTNSPVLLELRQHMRALIKQSTDPNVSQQYDSLKTDFGEVDKLEAKGIIKYHPRPTDYDEKLEKVLDNLAAFVFSEGRKHSTIPEERVQHPDDVDRTGTDDHEHDQL